jgi:hypothetical protein
MVIHAQFPFNQIFSFQENAFYFYFYLYLNTFFCGSGHLEFLIDIKIYISIGQFKEHSSQVSNSDPHEKLCKGLSNDYSCIW